MVRSAVLLLLLCMGTLLAAPTPSLPPIEFHVVAPSGGARPTSHRIGSSGAASFTSFTSLAAAQLAIRQLPRAQRQRGVVVTVHGGTHPSLELTGADSGGPGSPVIWQGIGSAIISAGVSLPGIAFTPWAAVPGAFTASLRALGLANYGNLSTSDSGTGNLGCTHNRSSLFFHGQMMTLARFPNINRSSGVWSYSLVDRTGGGGKFGISTEDPSALKLVKWAAEERNPWLHGYWYYSWSDGYVPLVAAVGGGGQHLPPCIRNARNGTTCDPCTGSLDCPRVSACPAVAHTVCVSGHCRCTNQPSSIVNISVGAAGKEDGAAIKAGGRFYGVNIKSELDSEGEFYIEDETGLLYFFPPMGSGPPAHWAAGAAVVSFNDTAVSLVNVSHLELRGLTILGARHTGIQGSGISFVRIVNCTVSGVGRHGIDIDGVNSGVESTHVYSVGGSGMRIVGGEAMTLTPGNMWAHDNHVHDIGQWKRTYQPALFWGGVNNSYARNLLEDGPAMCIWGGGNVADGVDCHFDSNIVNRCVTETCDQGSFHTCGQSGNAFINRGNVMENGLFTNIQPGKGVLNPPRGLPAICSPITVGFYMDDEMSGWLVRNNTFVDCQTAMLLGGGRDAVITENTIVNCTLGLHYDNRGMNWEQASNCPLAIAGLRKTLQGPAGELYKQRWPEMLHVLSDPNASVCDPKNDSVFGNDFSNTPMFCDTTAADVASWGSQLRNNTNLTPQPPPPPFKSCHANPHFKPSGVTCAFSVVMGATQNGHTWHDEILHVFADKDDCFLFDGSCAATGTVGASCMKNYNDTANLLKTANGTVVGEGHCCWNPTGVHDHVKQVTRLKCGSEMRRPVSIEGTPPVAIGTHVLTDKAGLDRQRTNATFVLHRPVKDPNNPILGEDRLWEDRMHMFGSVVQVSADEWRIYYLVDGRFGLHNCVAVSRDGGASWVKPSLGLVPWGAIANLSDSTANNILGSDHNTTNEGKDWLGWIGLNEGDADPSRRFVATMGPPSWFKTLPAACTPFGPTRRDAAFLAFSADGLTFRMPTSTECYLSSKDDSQNPIVFFNNQTLWFNRQDEMGVHRNCADHVAGPQRRVGVAKFETLLTPSKPGMDLYTSNAMAYEDSVLAFPTPFQHTPAVGLYPDGSKVGSDGPLWTRFVSSRDPLIGLEYPAGDRAPWITRGEGVFDNVSKTFRGAWDAGMAFAFQGMLRANSSQKNNAAETAASCAVRQLPAGATVVTRAAWQAGCAEWDQLQQYYFGSQATHHTQSSHFGNSSDGIGRVTIRRDGFASLTHSVVSADLPHSLVVTQPFMLPNSCAAGAEVVLMVNVRVVAAAGGSVRINLADADTDNELPGFSLGESDAITDGSVRAVASWSGRSALGELAGAAGHTAATAVTMTIELQHAEIFAWEWRCV